MLTIPGSGKSTMKTEERAIIHTLNVGGEDVTVSKFYGITVDLTAHSVKIRTSKRMQLGGNVEVLLNLESHKKSYHLSGVITGIEDSRGKDPGYLVHITLNHKQDGDTPRLAGGKVPVMLHLLSPAQRPMQVTQDLKGFWQRTWPEVKKELKGRYPKHQWPEDPTVAVPSRTGRKPRGT